MNGSRTPTLLPVIGWTSLAGALALLLGGLLGFKLIALAREPGLLPMPPGIPETMDLKTLIRPLEGTLRILSWAQILLAPPTVVISVEFLKRKSWARRGMEMLTWCTLLLTAAFPFVIVPFWNGVFRAALFLDPEAPLPGVLPAAGPALGVLITILPAIPLVMTLRTLRSSRIRSACVL